LPLFQWRFLKNEKHMWILDIYTKKGETVYNIYELSKTNEHVHHSGLFPNDILTSTEFENNHLIFDTEEDAKEFGEILKNKYFQKRDN